MAQVSEAIYARGVLKPVGPLDLRENQRVRIIVEPLDESREDRAVALERLKAGIASMRFFSAGRLSSRGEWHERYKFSSSRMAAYTTNHARLSGIAALSLHDVRGARSSAGYARASRIGVLCSPGTWRTPGRASSNC